MTVVGVVAFAAAPASAILVRLPGGRELSYAAAGASSAPHTFDAVFSNLDYSGGPVMPSNTNYTVVWNPSGYSGLSFQTGYVTGVDKFFTDLAHDSGHSTNSDAVAVQYNDASGHTAAYSSSDGGVLPVDTDPLPANGCSAASTCLTDAQLQHELNKFLSLHSLPHDLTHEYFLLTPPALVSCFDNLTSDGCSANVVGGDLSTEYCAYHGQTTGGYLYANIPDLTGVDGCDPYTTFCPTSSCDYPNGPADGMLTAISHEHVESVTDPQPNNAWTDWGGTVGYEIGDKCNNDAFQDPHTVVNPQPDGHAAPYNETIGGGHYWIQREWSNQTHQCLDSWLTNGTSVTASFTQSTGSGTTVNFDASPSHVSLAGTVRYVWQFNDGPGQTFTVEQTTPTISHTFPAHSVYDVALTVMASDGTSSATAHSVGIGSPPTAGFAAPSGVEGSPVGFSATGASDPNPGGSITSYSWNFGDGSFGSGATTSHTYSHFGTYTVTLTVTDNLNVSSVPVSHTVTIADEAPVASFNPGTHGQARIPVSFLGSGLDLDGTLSYSWSFGDGATGTGSSVSHSFRSPGVYHVTLTVTDSGGLFGSVSHQVRIDNSCLVPGVKHKSLKAASKAIKAAHCAVGKVKRPKSHKNNLVVKQQSPSGGRVERAGFKVNLTLG